MNIELSETELRTARHESEGPLATLALVGVVPLAIWAGFAVIGTLFTIVLVVFIFARIIEARMRGGAIEVGYGNFPEVHADIDEISRILGYRKPVRVFITQESDVNAFLWRFFGRRYLALNSELVMQLTRDERRFIIGFFVGSLRSRHLRFHEAAALIQATENLKVLNIFVLPYLRASVFTGDRFGLLAVGKRSDVAMSALKKLMMGGGLAPQLSTEAIRRQAIEQRRSIFRKLSVLLSSHPHMTDRFLELDDYITKSGLQRAVSSPVSAAAVTPPAPNAAPARPLSPPQR